MPVAVEQEKGAPHGMGTFLLHQGIQRRVSITIVHESGPELIWRDVKELVVGRIRKTPEWCELDGENTVLSLSLLPAHYMQHNNDDRYVYVSCVLPTRPCL